MNIFVATMQNNLTHNTLSKWLLTATLFLSLFTFSGYTATVTSRQYESTKTEQILFTRNSKRTFSYQAGIASLYKIIISNTVPEPLHRTISFLHSKLVKTSLGVNLARTLPHSCAVPFFHLKTIPQSSDEDVSLT